MRKTKEPDRLHGLFRIGMWLKGLDGLAEVAGGTLLALVSRGEVVQLVHHLVRGELSEDPHDLVANALLGMAQRLSVGTKLFVTAYLLVHGLVKLGLVAGLLAEKRRVFPVALGVLGLFLAYQIYRLTESGSVWLAGFTLLDAAIIGLVAREWRVLVRQEPGESPG